MPSKNLIAIVTLKHRAAVEAGDERTQHIGETISESHKECKKYNRSCLLKICQNIRFLARQGLPLRGNWVEKENAEVNSNFNQLLLFRSIDDPNFRIGPLRSI